VVPSDVPAIQGDTVAQVVPRSSEAPPISRVPSVKGVARKGMFGA
jgi:hypothetical protein